MKKNLLILLLAICSFVGVFLLNSNVIAAANPLELILTSPGEIASSEMSFSWRSTKSTSTFYYSDNLTSNVNTWNKIDVNGVIDNTTFKDEAIGNYHYELDLEDLKPGTKYVYQITSGSSTSSKYYFETAYETGDFSFLWVSDNHAYASTSDRQTKFQALYDKAKATLGNIPLVVSTGDDVAYGGTYNCWQTMLNGTNGLNFFKETAYISTPGNHSCYEYNSSSIPSTESDRFFDAVINTPDNGTDEGSTSYWFIYNSVLFISLDSIVANSKGATYIPMQKQFFIDTVKANEGKYQYIIVYQHYPFMNALTGNRFGPYGTNYGKWYELFDEYGVDLALSGDHHCYYRSNSLYNDKVVDEGGTMYIGAPQIGGRHREITETQDAEYYAKRITSADLNGNSGATYFTVTSESITGTLIDTNGTVHDTYTVKAKRAVNWSSQKDSIASSINIAYSEDKTYLVFDNEYSKYVETLEVYNGNIKLFTFKPYETKKTSFELTNLPKNKAYNLTFKLTFADHTTKDFDKIVHTFGHIGEIYNLQANINNSKMNISWNADLQNNIVANFKIYKNKTLLNTVSSSTRSYEINLSEVDSSTSYTLEAITSTGEVVYKETIVYSLIGDASFDGKLDKEDINTIINGIKANKQYSENELSYLDLNKNNVIDLGDAFTINAYINNKISNMISDTFLVTIIDINGTVLLQETVKYNENSSFTSNSYNFTVSLKNIKNDTTAVAVNK